VLIGVLAIAIIGVSARGKTAVRLLGSEKDGPASLSRFQFLMFTFVIGMCLLVLTLESGEFPKVTPEILGLLGISGGSYVVSKGIQKTQDEAKTSQRAG